MAQFKVVYLEILACIVIVGNIHAQEGCSFEKDGCTYNIHLKYKDDTIVGAETENVECAQKPQEFKILDRAQRDYTAKIDEMEQNLSFLKDDHEQKIKVTQIHLYYKMKLSVYISVCLYVPKYLEKYIKLHLQDKVQRHAQWMSCDM